MTPTAASGAAPTRPTPGCATTSPLNGCASCCPSAGEVERYELPNLRALNFVLKGFLGEGVMSNTNMDPQAKSLGEYLRAKLVDVPEALL